MKIVGFLHSAPPERVVGGEMMTLRLLAHSAEQGHDVSVIVRSLAHDSWFGKVRLISGSTTDSQKTLNACNNAELMVTHPEIASSAFRYTSRIMRIPFIGIVHNLSRTTLRGMALRPSMVIVANSHRTALLLIDSKSTGERPLTVLYPPTAPPTPPVPGLPREFATMVNLSTAKGSAVLQKLTDALPDVPFLPVLGGHGEQNPPVDRHGNITLYGHVSTLGLPLGLTKVFIAPSRDETYGMAVCEATMLGIPVVASDIDAHREALGDSATFLDMDDYPSWISAVRTLMTDESAWKTAHLRTLKYAEVLKARNESTFEKWDRLVARVAGS